jgi:hypothetical protein
MGYQIGIVFWAVYQPQNSPSLPGRDPSSGGIGHAEAIGVVHRDIYTTTVFDLDSADNLLDPLPSKTKAGKDAAKWKIAYSPFWADTEAEKAVTWMGNVPPEQYEFAELCAAQFMLGDIK